MQASVCVEIVGGLANQMFQYATGRSLALHLSCPLKLDLSTFQTYADWPYQLDIFDIDAEVVSQEELRQFVRKKTKLEWQVERYILRRRDAARWEGVFDERGFGFDPELYAQTPPIFLRGYWQSPKYFAHQREELLRIFTPKTPLSPNARETMRQIAGGTAVSIHVRRGDYVRRADVAQVHGTCSLDYYRRAVGLIRRLYADARFYVFSDDPQYVRDSFDFCPNYSLVGGNDDKPHEDMLLMSRCRHHIIANSSFSWWGAWLNRQPDKTVIAPRRWFSDEKLHRTFTYDLYPEEWITLE